MSDRYISLWDLAHAADSLTTTLVTANVHHNHPIPPLPCYEGGAAIALHASHLMHEKRESEAILSGFSLPAALMPVEAFWFCGERKERDLQSALESLYPPDGKDTVRCVSTYDPVEQSFMILPRFYVARLWLEGYDARVKAVLREPHLDKVLLPTAHTHADFTIITSGTATFFRLVQEHLDARGVFSPHDPSSDEELANFSRPLAFLEKLKELSEHHQKRTEHGPLQLTPHNVQREFQGIPSYPHVLAAVKKHWLIRHRLDPHSMEYVTPLAKEAALWLHRMWVASPEGKGETGLRDHKDKTAWMRKRGREIQDTLNWAVWLLDPSLHADPKKPFIRPMKASLQQDLPRHLHPL
ncbi:hypothetical protein JCM11251_003373 [Rhodosporidiobolus azoricus]